LLATFVPHENVFNINIIWLLDFCLKNNDVDLDKSFRFPAVSGL